jgi:COMPASS component SWD3
VIRIFRLNSSSFFTCDLELEGHIYGVNDIAWSPNSDFLASASDDKTVRIWSLAGGRQATVLSGHTNYVYCVKFSPIGNLIASGSYDESVRLWDPRKGTIVRAFPAHSDACTSIDFSPDGTIVVSGGQDGLIRLWDTVTGQCLKTLVEDNNPPASFVSFSPNGRYVLAGTLDSALRLWDYVSGKCAKTYHGHRSRKYNCFAAFYFHGEETLFSGSDENILTAWDVQTKKVRARIPVHSGALIALDVHPEQALIAVGSLDGRVSIAHFGKTVPA